jgi:hypothetical protein
VITVATSHPVAKAVLAALRVAWPRVGDGVAPTDGTLPYAVLYRAGGGPLGGPLGDHFADGQPLLQLTCVGATAEQADWLAGKLRPTLLATPTVVGQVVMQVSLETSQPVRRDDSTSPPLFYAADQARFYTTPA